VYKRVFSRKKGKIRMALADKTAFFGPRLFF
jgi:hypothetical protein